MRQELADEALSEVDQLYDEANAVADRVQSTSSDDLGQVRYMKCAISGVIKMAQLV